MKTEEDADEIVNDTFMIIWEKRNELKLDASLKPFLYTIVRNKSLNLLKKKKLDLAEFTEDFEPISEYPSAIEVIEAKQTEELVSTLMNQLPPKCKQIFVLSRKEFLSNKEIAAILDISEKTVENQITIAIRFIRNGLVNQSKTKGGKPLILFPWVAIMLNLMN